MQVFLKSNTDAAGLWWVFCHEPSFYLGPYPSSEAAEEIRSALDAAYNHGKTEIQEGLRELIGVSR